MLLLAIFYAIPDFYLIPSFSLIRQGLAASLFFYGVRCYMGQRKTLAWLLFGIATSVHYSVLGALFFLFLAFKINLNRRTLLVVFTFALSFYMLSIDAARLVVGCVVSYVDPKYMIYLERDVYNASLIYRTAYAAASVFAFACIYLTWFRQSVTNGGFVVLESNVSRLAVMGVLIPLLVFGFPTISTRYQYFYSILLWAFVCQPLSISRAAID